MRLASQTTLELTDVDVGSGGYWGITVQYYIVYVDKGVKMPYTKIGGKIMPRTTKKNDVTMNDLQELMLQMMKTMNEVMDSQKAKSAKETAPKRSTKKSAPKKQTKGAKSAPKKGAKETEWVSKEEYKAQFSEADRMAYGKIAREVRSEMLAEAQVNGYWDKKEYKAEFKARMNARLGKGAK